MLCINANTINDLKTLNYKKLYHLTTILNFCMEYHQFRYPISIDDKINKNTIKLSMHLLYLSISCIPNQIYVNYANLRITYR